MGLAGGPERQLRAVHPACQPIASHGRGQCLVSEQRPQLVGGELPILQVPGGEREGEVEADDQVRVAIGLGDQQLGELGAGPAAFEPNKLPGDDLGQPDRLPLLGGVPPRPVDSHQAGLVHACRVRPRTR